MRQKGDEERGVSDLEGFGFVVLCADAAPARNDAALRRLAADDESLGRRGCAWERDGRTEMREPWRLAGDATLTRHNCRGKKRGDDFGCRSSPLRGTSSNLFADLEVFRG